MTADAKLLHGEGALANKVAAVRAGIDDHVKAQRMGGDDRWALGYNEGVLKMAMLWKRELDAVERLFISNGE